MHPIPELHHIPLLRDVPSDLLHAITPNLVRFYTDGQVLFRQGDRADTLYILLHGQISIFTDGVFLVTRSPFAVVGEQAFINNTPRTATAVAQGMVKVLALPCGLVYRLLDDATFIHNLLILVSAELADSTQERAFRFRNEQLLYQELCAHLSPQLAERLLTVGPEYGAPRFADVAILYADMRDFTLRSDRMRPSEIAHQLSTYFDAVVEVIHQHGGLVDKFVGDAVLANWGVLVADSQPAVQALVCAEALVRAAERLTFGGEPITVGIGLNYGEVFVGNVGGHGKRQFTLLGTPVNVASRLERATKALGVSIAVGDDFYAQLPSALQADLQPHACHEMRGLALQTVYTYAPGPPAVDLSLALAVA